MRNLGVVVSLAAAAALFGWIMVASGLVNRPWVNAYKLTIHLGLGISLFIFLFYTFLKERGFTIEPIPRKWMRMLTLLFILAILQVCFGGLVSGMKAALNGVPSLSVLDGWWIEGCIEGTTGWAIGQDGHAPETATDSVADAAALYAKLEQVVMPAFYKDRDRFINVMLHTVALNGSFFNTQRMVQQYVLKAYFE